MNIFQIRASRSLSLMLVESGEMHELRLEDVDVCHETDRLFSVAFVDDLQLAVILQDRDSGALFVCKADIDVQVNTVDIRTVITNTGIRTRNGYSVELIREDMGMVLVNFPHKISPESPIELLTLGQSSANRGADFFARSLSVRVKSTNTDGLWCDPFISRNCVYFFDQFEPKLLCVALSADQRGASHLLRTYPDPRHGHPSRKFVNRAVQAVDDAVLVYFHQRVDKPDAQPQLWRLELSSLEWRKVTLTLSHHWPMARVCFQKSAEGMAFLHGDCRVSGCTEKAHLYEIDLDEVRIMFGNRRS